MREYDPKGGYEMCHLFQQYIQGGTLKKFIDRHIKCIQLEKIKLYTS